MYPLHDNDLDRLSREAAEQFEVEPGTSGWDHLEKRLNQEIPQKKDRRRFLFWLFLVSITTGGALIAILKNNTPAGHLAKNTIPVASQQKANAPVNSSTATQENVTIDNSIKNNTSSNNNTNPVTGTTINAQPDANNKQVTGNRLPSPNAVSKQQTSPTVNQPQTITEPATPANKKLQHGNTPAGNKKVKTTSHQPAIDKDPLSLNYATVTPQGQRVKNKTYPVKQRKHKQAQPQRTTDDGTGLPIQRSNKAGAEPDNTIAANDQTTGAPVNAANDPSISKPAEAADAGAVTNKTTQPATADSTTTPVQQPVKKEKDTKKNDKVNQLELGLVAGPDYSVVHFGPLYQTGYNFGLQIGYRFSNRWSVNPGIIYTKKFYQADSQYYHPKYPIPPGKNLDNVTGNCSMWEIPVNVRYDVAYNEKRRWFVSTGLSTYLMDKENYILNYYSSTAGTYPYPIPSDTNTQYPFSIVNISAGFERSLGKRFSFQAEPYLKIPLKGLGLGNMRMQSYGVYFTLKYKPNFKPKK